MELAEDHYLLEAALKYTRDGSYPSTCTAALKRSIRRKAEKFTLRDGQVYFKKKRKGEVCSRSVYKLYRCEGHSFYIPCGYWSGRKSVRVRVGPRG